MNFNIRSANVDDVPLILRFIKELAEYEEMSDMVQATEPMLRLALFGEQRNCEVLFACEDQGEGEVEVGFALFFHNFSTFLGCKGLYLEDVYVRPVARGKGYGKAIMVYLARLAVERGCGRFEWNVLDWNQTAIDFYRSMGAVGMDEWRLQRVTGEALKALAQR
jgi:GNAT superfamily N-acetyltransferase